MSEVALKPGCAVQEASVANEIRSSAELCRAALATDPLASVGQLSLAPQSPQACFDLVLGIPYDARCMEVVRRLKRDAAERGHSAPFAVERFLALQTYLVALPLLQQMPVPDSIKRQFCITCRDIASTPQQPDQRLALESHEFPELAQIATLRRFHAGQCSFDVIRRMPFAWLLKAHPFDLSGFIGTLCFGMRGVGPMVEPHINWWRANQMLLTKREHERSIWRIAQFVEERPEIKGLVSSSWLYGVETGDQSPHLAWLREFYAAEKARIIDAGPVVDAEERGFLVGNELRRKQYVSGVFRPRETIVLWSRADMLAWARRHPELADGAGQARRSTGAQADCQSACSDPGPPLAERQMDADRRPAPAVLSAARLYCASPSAAGATRRGHCRSDVVAGRDAAGVCRACRLPLGVSVLLSPGTQAIVTKSFAANSPSGGEVLIMLTVLSSLPPPRGGRSNSSHDLGGNYQHQPRAIA